MLGETKREFRGSGGKGERGSGEGYSQQEAEPRDGCLVELAVGGTDEMSGGE